MHSGMREWRVVLVGWSEGNVANITTAYINDIPGTSVKKSSRWPPSARCSICKQLIRKQHVIPTHARLKRAPMYLSKDSFSQLLNDFPV